MYFSLWFERRRHRSTQMNIFLLGRHWECEVQKATKELRSPSLTKVIIRCYWRPYAVLGIFTLIEVCATNSCFQTEERMQVFFSVSVSVIHKVSNQVLYVHRERKHVLKEPVVTFIMKTFSINSKHVQFHVLLIVRPDIMAVRHVNSRRLS